MPDDPVLLAKLLAVAVAAREYRAEAQASTPRLWTGKKLHDLAIALDEALAALAEDWVRL